jgi:TolB protein
MFNRKTLYSLLVIFLISCGGGGAGDTLQQNMTNRELTPEEVLVQKAKKSQSPDDYLELARFYAENKRTNDALNNFDNALRLDSARSDIRIEYSEYAYNNNQVSLALDEFLYILNMPDGFKYTDVIASYLFDYKITQITFGPHNSANPSFSFDSQRIYFQSDQNGNWDIMSMDLTGGDVRIEIGTAFNEESPTESANGRFLAYTSDADDDRTIDNSQKWREIMVFDRRSNLSTRLTQNYCDDFSPVFNKNGTELLFLSERYDVRNLGYGERFTNIVKMDFDGTFQIPVTTRAEFYDNSGVRIEEFDETIFSSNREGKYNLFSINNTTKKISPFILQSYNMISVDALPDKSKIVFTGDRFNSLDLFMTDKYGSRIQRLTKFTGNEDKASFSPDGNYIVFHSDKGGQYDIYLLNLQSREVEPTVNNLIDRINQIR